VIFPGSLTLAVLSLLVWIYLRYGRGRFWSVTSDHDLNHVETGEPWPAVAAVIPARDEEPTIGETVASLLAQDYPGAFHVIVVDDNSTDDTAGRAREAGRARPWLTVHAGAPRPAGWTGKTWAMHQGVEMAREVLPQASWVWLTDADIVHGPDTLRRLVAAGEQRGCALVSLMVKLSCRSFWERLLIPPYIFFFQKMFPFTWVNDPGHRMAAAAGGCVLVRRDVLARAGGIEAIRDRIIDDCALAAAVKPHGAIWLGLSGRSYSLRPYRKLTDLWDLVVRTAYAGLDYSRLRLALALVGMLIAYPGPWIALALAVNGEAWDTAAVALCAVTLQALCYRPVTAFYGLSPGWVPGLPFAATLYAAMTLDSAIRHASGRGGRWKGRTFDPRREASSL
jgi:hopene-associated glycosyltransferase HpnB